jgi:hypothetical protein
VPHFVADWHFFDMRGQAETCLFAEGKQTLLSRAPTSENDPTRSLRKTGFCGVNCPSPPFSRLQIADLISRIANRRWLILHLGGKG